MTDIDKLIDIKLARARAARELGGGKKGGVQSTCQALNCKEMSKAPPWRKNHLYRACFQTFINDETTTSMPLKEGRTMPKGPPRDGQARTTITTIAALFFQQRDHHDVLSDFRCNFNRHQSLTSLGGVASPTHVGLCALSGSAKQHPEECPIFAKFDSCGTVGESSMPDGFFGISSDVRFMVNGIKSSSPFITSESQPFGMLLFHDGIADSPFIGCCGGMLKASQADMTPDIILSNNQMSDAWLESDTVQGARAHLADRITAHFEVSGGRRVRAHRRDGHPGIFCQPITASDPRWEKFPRVWISGDKVCHPKNVSNGVVINKMICSTSDDFLQKPVHDPIDNKSLATAVDLSLQKSGQEMAKCEDLQPLSLDSPSQERAIEARFGGHHMAKIQLALKNMHGGSAVLTGKGKRRLETLTKTKFRHPGARFRSMKTKKKAKLDRVLRNRKFQTLPGH
jgi:hypothetical protein